MTASDIFVGAQVHCFSIVIARAHKKDLNTLRCGAVQLSLPKDAFMARAAMQPAFRSLASQRTL
eukprot:237917-Amphidinium_carterae.2